MITHVDQWNRIENSYLSSPIYWLVFFCLFVCYFVFGGFFVEKKTKIHIGENTASSTNNVGKTGSCLRVRIKLDLYLSPSLKTNSKSASIQQRKQSIEWKKNSLQNEGNFFPCTLGQKTNIIEKSQQKMKHKTSRKQTTKSKAGYRSEERGLKERRYK